MEFDINIIKEGGKSPITSAIITNINKVKKIVKKLRKLPNLY